jgi:hypothetical protein
VVAKNVSASQIKNLPNLALKNSPLPLGEKHAKNQGDETVS